MRKLTLNKQKVLLIFLLILLIGCVDPFQFTVIDNDPSLVVEGLITDKSFNETVLYPSSGRFFTVKLSYTSDVTNERGKPVLSAHVGLVDNLGNNYIYTETGEGVYMLLDSDFLASRNVMYKIEITISEDEKYESDWSTLPDEEVPPFGNVGFQQIEKQVYRTEAEKQVVKTIKGINANVELPIQSNPHSMYYQWSFDPTWVYIAPLADANSQFRKCWAESKTYISDFALREDIVGGYKSPLFFIETVRNERIFYDLSVLVTQKVTNRDYFFFLKELQEQNQGGLLSDKPPYNLDTNMKAVRGDRKVVGFFSVAQEQAFRWYFNKDDLSYYVDDTLLADCLVYYGPGGPAPECLNCLEYSFGDARNVEPSWWRK